MHEAMKAALEKAKQNSASMVAAGTKESYEDPYHRNSLARGGRAAHPDEAEDKKLIAKEFKKRGLKSGGKAKK